MTQMVKTTVMLPESKLKQAKIKAVNERTTLSQIIARGLERELTMSPKRADKGPEPTHRLGVLKLGISKIYNKRSDLYEEHLKRKMGY